MDDLAYLAKHKIDRNLVSREIAEITARMIHITGALRALTVSVCESSDERSFRLMQNFAWRTHRLLPR